MVERCIKIEQLIRDVHVPDMVEAPKYDDSFREIDPASYPADVRIRGGLSIMWRNCVIPITYHKSTQFETGNVKAVCVDPRDGFDPEVGIEETLIFTGCRGVHYRLDKTLQHVPKGQWVPGNPVVVEYDEPFVIKEERAKVPRDFGVWNVARRSEYHAHRLDYRIVFRLRDVLC